MLKLGVLGSTKGTDLQAIIDAIEQGTLNAEINMVISNIQNAYILERANKHKIPNKFISDKNIDRDEFANILTEHFVKCNVDIILLIGFMKILSNKFCQVWKDKILNVHPSLLPKYAGGINNDVHKQVLLNNDNETGCTIHYVTEDVDSGPILIQKKCAVFKDDDIDSLKLRVQKLEGAAFIEALHMIENQTYA
jgi:phosphoribosylglycinamide formyltransferase-1